MSGIAEIIWSLGGSRLFFLYIRSPIARDKFRLPLTRPSLLIKPPAFCIRALSVAFCGLWSKDNGTDFPLTDRTQRESPAFAQKIVPGELVVGSSGTIKTTFAVQPRSSILTASFSSSFKRFCNSLLFFMPYIMLARFSGVISWGNWWCKPISSEWLF